jgi:thiosulfate/3-mercaptopyruvate sulfurtransferase
MQMRDRYGCIGGAMVSLALLACGSGETTRDSSGDDDLCTRASAACPRDSLLIEAAALAAAPPGRVIIDLRDEVAYGAGHVPGARRLDPAALRAEVDGIVGQAAPRASVEATLGALGVSAGEEVVVYDAGEGLTAARFAWTTALYGGVSARALDGGWAAWTAGGWPQEQVAATPTATSLALLGGDATARVDAAWVLAHLEDPAVVLVDARSEEEFVLGHIPGARWIPWQRAKGADQRFLSDQELRAVYEGDGVLAAETVVAYCQTGTRASVTWLSLKLLGHRDVRIYDGSWAEWGSDPALPKGS